MFSVRATAISLLLLTGAACSDDDDGSSKSPRPGESYATLAEACDAACKAQAQAGCRNDPTLDRCIDSCATFPDVIHGCTAAWKNLNGCMADSPLFCEAATGFSAVSSKHCGPEMDALDACLSDP